MGIKIEEEAKIEDKYKGEQIMVIPRRIFEKIGPFEGVKTDELEYAIQQIFGEDNEFFMNRAEAEQNPNFKQIIPYCIIRCGTKILNYTRGKSGNEDRLHAKISIGVGGHINKEEGASNGLETYNLSVDRELQEELIFDPKLLIGNEIVALVNDDINEVGKVHLGVVELIDFATINITAKEDCLRNLEFTELEELATSPLFDRLETWSQYLVKYMFDNK